MTLTSAIVDSHSADALIALAAKERLIWTKRETDGVFERICATQYNPKVQEQLLEQLVLTPKISFCGYSDYLWDALDGPLKQEGYLANLDSPSESSIHLKTMPLDVVAGLVGRIITEAELIGIHGRVQHALGEEREYEERNKKPVPNLLQEDILRVMTRNRLTNPSEYTDEDIEAQRHRSAVYKEFSPIASAIQEYARLTSVAERFGLMVKTPMLQGQSSTSFLNPKFEAGTDDSELVLFRIVAQQLGRTTFRPSLKGSLALASESATKSLREMLSIWYARLATGDSGELQRIQKEINRATKELKRRSEVQNLGVITTLLAVPISAAEYILQLPPVLGISVSSLGLMACRNDEKILNSYRWASYGGA